MKNGMVTKGKWEKFLTLKGENLLLVKRKHPYVLFFPIILTSLLLGFLICAVFYFFIVAHFSFSLFIITTLLLVSIGVSVITKTILDWYFHIYILTTRKIMEIWYTPLTGHVMNDVLLDQVNCTEIDLKRNGFLHEIFDIGDVALTFDRPTNQEVFVLKDIKGCYKMGVFLTQKLLDKKQMAPVNTIWFKNRQSNNASIYN